MILSVVGVSVVSEELEGVGLLWSNGSTTSDIVSDHLCQCKACGLGRLRPWPCMDMDKMDLINESHERQTMGLWQNGFWSLLLTWCS